VRVGGLMVASLNRRPTRLERIHAQQVLHQCRSCGLRHVQPLTIELVRQIIGPVSWMAPALLRDVTDNTPPQLCFCDPCCADPGDRWFARRSYGVDTPKA
jgi:hypothetical protein